MLLQTIMFDGAGIGCKSFGMMDPVHTLVGRLLRLDSRIVTRHDGQSVVDCPSTALLKNDEASAYGELKHLILSLNTYCVSLQFNFFDILSLHRLDPLGLTASRERP